MTTLKTWVYEKGSEAYVREKEILSLFFKDKSKDSPLFRKGNTEIFSRDILGLDV